MIIEDVLEMILVGIIGAWVVIQLVIFAIISTAWIIPEAFADNLDADVDGNPCILSGKPSVLE